MEKKAQNKLETRRVCVRARRRERISFVYFLAGFPYTIKWIFLLADILYIVQPRLFYVRVGPKGREGRHGNYSRRLFHTNTTASTDEFHDENSRAREKFAGKSSALITSEELRLVLSSPECVLVLVSVSVRC